MALINREQALSHPFANGQYDKEHADEHFIMGFEDYKEWLEDLPTVEAIPQDQINKAIEKVEQYICDVETDTVKAQGMAQALDIFEQALEEVEDGAD